MKTSLSIRKFWLINLIIGIVFIPIIALGFKLNIDQNCTRLPLIENWLTHRSVHWDIKLKREVGYESPESVAVCELTLGNPFSDLTNNRIFVKSMRTRNDKIIIAHEFLHLSFKNHPLGNDESFIERTAIKLVSDTGSGYENY